MDLSTLIDLIKNVGVPAALLFFMVWRFNGSIRSNTAANQANTLALMKLAERVDAMAHEVIAGRDAAVREIKAEIVLTAAKVPHP